jgi:hypothetical protein
MDDLKDLYERLCTRRAPELAGVVGDLALYESLIAGCADRVLRGGLLNISNVPVPDSETVEYMERLRTTNSDRSDAESAVLEYFELLEAIRYLLTRGNDQSCSWPSWITGLSIHPFGYRLTFKDAVTIMEHVAPKPAKRGP